jgi:hypothetical protein
MGSPDLLEFVASCTQNLYMYGNSALYSAGVQLTQVQRVFTYLANAGRLVCSSSLTVIAGQAEN